jgi:hypothetical protein
LVFIIWCLSDILKNSINKYFAKNGQKTFIKGLRLVQLPVRQFLPQHCLYFLPLPQGQG